MKRYHLLLVLFLFAGCVEDVPFLEENWVRVLGEETNSFGERILELENGDLMVLGELGIAAFDVVNPGDATEIGEIEDQGPAIFITDANGNLKETHAWPFDDTETEFVDFINFENTTRFIDIVNDARGGWTVLAESRNFDGIINGDTIMSTASSQFVTYFLFSLTGDFQLKEIKPVNFGADWDLRFRIRMSMQELNESQIILFAGWNFDFSQPVGSLPEGYDYFIIDHDLNFISNYRFLAPGTNKLGNRFIINDQNELIISGQVSNANGHFQTLFRNPIGSTTEQTIIVDQRGTFQPINNNEHFPIQLTDGRYAVAYTNAPGEIKVNVFDELLRSERIFSVGPFEKWEDPVARTGPTRSPRAFIPLDNGDMLLLTVFQPSREPFDIVTDLYRLTPTGNQVFHRRLQGTPGDIIQSQDGNIIIVTNSPYNVPFEKITIRKLSPNGKVL